MPTELTCPCCNGQFEQGFVVDLAHGAIHSARWYAGQITRTFFGNVNLRGRPSAEITTYRCTTCGYLESYAPTPPPKTEP